MWDQLNDEIELGATRDTPDDTFIPSYVSSGPTERLKPSKAKKFHLQAYCLSIREKSLGLLTISLAPWLAHKKLFNK